MYHQRVNGKKLFTLCNYIVTLCLEKLNLTIMKFNALVSVVVAIAAMTTISCTDDSFFLGLDRETINAEPIGGSTTIVVTSTVSWRASSDAEWVTISPATGRGDGNISVEIAANPTATERTATITVSGAGVKPQNVAVSQTADNPYIGVDFNVPSPVSVEGGTYPMKILSNVEWNITVTSEEDWINITPATGRGEATVQVTIAGNNLYIPRSAVITASGKDALPVPIIINQEARGFYAPESGTFAYSNIYLDSETGHLTFATEAYSGTDLYQGIYFKWGSLFGISPSDLTTTEPYLVFTPREYAGTKPSTWEGVPYYNEATDELRDYNAEAGIGDICRYISDKGWVPGQWRMATLNEYNTLIASGIAMEATSEQPMFDTNIDGTTSMGMYAKVVGTDYKLPHAGYRSPDLNRVNIFGYYWTASPSGIENANSLYLEHISSGQYGMAGHTRRSDGFSVRCIAE
jgi:uncharacterized protein (TIGR02145 family)